MEGDKVRRTWDEAQTPYQRLLAKGVLSPEQQERLQALYEQTNPCCCVKRSMQGWPPSGTGHWPRTGRRPNDRKELAAA